MLGCGKFLSFGAEFVVQQVVELLRARPLVVSVAGVRVVEFGTYAQIPLLRHGLRPAGLRPSLSRKKSQTMSQ